MNAKTVEEQQEMLMAMVRGENSVASHYIWRESYRTS